MCVSSAKLNFKLRARLIKNYDCVNFYGESPRKYHVVVVVVVLFDFLKFYFESQQQQQHDIS